MKLPIAKLRALLAGDDHDDDEREWSELEVQYSGAKTAAVVALGQLVASIAALLSLRTAIATERGALDRLEHTEDLVTEDVRDQVKEDLVDQVDRPAGEDLEHEVDEDLERKVDQVFVVRPGADE